MDAIWGVVLATLAFLGGAFLHPFDGAAQTVTSPPAPIGTGSGALYTYASQPIDVTILILALFGFVFFLLFVFATGAWLVAHFGSVKAQAENNKQHIESNQEVLQLRSDSNFLRDDSKEQAAASHSLVRDIAKELLNQSKSKDEIARLVGLTQETPKP